ncbi:pig-Q [Exophiala xenobiotica]|uniref:Pig-Q n=1 Tax=Lithohypha guttulata TaxID=1690604 RepID=A0ABR0KKU1_9EURO|nr:pig-Q [Lithohypha guttulata]KAK5325433.1 pig-Q [Exophiala xenobiotica]
MVKNSDGLLRLLWPATLARSTTPGVIVGWRNSDLDLFVVTVLEDVELRSVEIALRTRALFRGCPFPIEQMMDLCGRKSMSVLGTFNHGDTLGSFDLGQIQVVRASDQALPQVFCPLDLALSAQVVLYTPPDPTQFQYISLDPINLTLGHRTPTSNNTRAGDEVEAEDQHEKRRVAALVQKLKFHTVMRHKPTLKELALPIIIRQINCSFELATLLQKNTPFVGPRRKREISVSERVVESAQSLYTVAVWSIWTIFMNSVYPALSYAFKLAIVLHRTIAEGLLQCLEFRLPLRRMNFPDSTGTSSNLLSLKDISAACQQVHLRLQQFSYYPIQYTLLRRRYGTWSSIAGTNSDYIRFYNSLWLVANDVILGIAVGSFINENADATAHFVVDVLNQYTINGLRDTIRWLMSYPGGLKLNTELAAFLGDLFLWVIEYWSASSRLLVLPYLPKIVYLIGFSSFAGASMPIAIFSDFLSLMTVHIYAFYVASARIFNWQLSILVSLFQLFRGKKRNVLRNRIDNCDYDLDQLLLGTILFTLLFFLLPTVIVFYLTFATARMAIITFKAILDTCLACLNRFPLFALMLKVKDSQRLPGGVHFELLESKQTPSAVQSPLPIVEVDTEDEDQEGELPAEGTMEGPQTATAYIRLSSTPLSIRQIFEQYFQLGGRIRKHYLSPKVVFRLLTGRFVPPLGRGEMYGMQYSVLPRERADMSEVWKGLFEKQKEQSTNAFDPDGNVFGDGLRGLANIRGNARRW